MSELTNEITNLTTNLITVYSALEAAGAELPAQKNFANLAATIRTIPTAPISYPNTLTGLKQALDAAAATTYFPIGTEIPDTVTLNGQTYDNPWLVMDYDLSATLTNGTQIAGVYLVQKYSLPPQAWNSTNVEISYGNSTINNWLNTTCLNSICSSELRGLVTPIKVPCYNFDTQSGYTTNANLWLLSNTEIMGEPIDLDDDYEPIGAEGVPFALWKQRTGLTTPNDWAGVSGRIINTVTNKTGEAEGWWTRSGSDYNFGLDRNDAIMVWDDGVSGRRTGVTAQLPPLVACFIKKG